MNRMMVRGIIAGLLAAGVVVLSNCGVSKQELAGAEKRMEELKTKGVPDSVLSKVKVYLFEAREAAEKNESSRARKAADSLEVALQEMESYYADHVAKLPPVIDSLLDETDKARSELSGMQIRKLDSLQAAVDSLMKNSAPVEAERLARGLVEYMDTLKADEAKAKQLRSTVPGTWVCTNKKKAMFSKRSMQSRRRCSSSIPTARRCLSRPRGGRANAP